MEEAPADASSLIYIAKADAFDAVARCVHKFLVPSAVWREAVVDGERVGAPEVPRIRAAEAAAVLERVALSASEHGLAGTIAAENRLGSGESEVLAIGLRLGHAVIDEGRASRVARALGITAISTLFLPVVGWQSSRLSRGDAMALLLHLAAVTGARSDVVQEIENELGGERR
jgi:predicted nucleic acid-binding protein